MDSSSRGVPATPRVISPSPTPSETRDKTQQRDGYFGPVTRSAKKKNLAAQVAISEELDGDAEDDEAYAELRRSRTRSRSPLKQRKINGLTPAKLQPDSLKSDGQLLTPNGKEANGHLSPSSAPGWSWGDISRSPSPLGLIPIHRQWRSFVHRHEVPRKLLHVSIGFLTLWLYVSGVQTNAITPYLMAGLIPVTALDYIRHNYPGFNRFYVRCVGILMRETEYAGWNGVIWYLLGAWIVLGFFPKDVAVVSILLLSWCDTAASTVGRALGRYTPRIRRGKSLAGSLAAFAVGAITAALFWGWLAPRTGPFIDDIDWPFMFTGTLALPARIRDVVGLSRQQCTISGKAALGMMSLWTGFVGAASEAVDLFGWDDNLTIPLLSGLGLYGFLKIFG
ncbi:Diacylglycerol kinase (ATP), partial [Scytalidium lignicola]